MGFPCPMCLHNPQRYEKVEGACITKGPALVVNVIQHLIYCHLHICRICTGVLCKVSNHKSAKAYNTILAEHGKCSKKKWPEKNDTLEPEILSEKQQAFVLGWDRKKIWAKCNSNAHGPDKELVLYRALYEGLHGVPLKKDVEKWTYLVPAHKQDERVDAEIASERAALKRKRDELDREKQQFREEVQAWGQPLLVFPDGRSLDFLTQGETEAARRTPLDLPDGFPQFVNPKHLSLGNGGPTEQTDAIMLKNLKQTLLTDDAAERDLSDSGYSSKHTDGREVH